MTRYYLLKIETTPETRIYKVENNNLFKFSVTHNRFVLSYYQLDVFLRCIKTGEKNITKISEDEAHKMLFLELI